MSRLIWGTEINEIGYIVPKTGDDAIGLMIPEEQELRLSLLGFTSIQHSTRHEADLIKCKALSITPSLPGERAKPQVHWLSEFLERKNPLCFSE